MVSGLVGWDLGDKKGTAMETSEDLEEFDCAEEMEDRYPNVDPEQTEYVDDMLVVGDDPLGEGSGCLLVLVAIASCVWMSVN